VRLKAGERVVRLERQLSQRNQHLQEANARLCEARDRIESDLAAAARSHESLLPRPGLMGGIAVDWMFQPSSHVGGDVFDVLPLDGSTLLFFHIDVVGHGVRAALHSFAVHGLLSVALGRRPTEDDLVPAEAWWRQVLPILQGINEQFCSAAGESSYCTMLLGLVDGATGSGSLIQAGHPSPLLLRRDGAAATFLGEGGLPLGLIPGADWQPVAFALAPGDRLVLYSDDIIEAERPDDGPFSAARLAQYFAEAADRPLADVINGLHRQLDDWRQGAAPEDDLSLLVLERPSTRTANRQETTQR
jgi:phosphoserine phosphatase RsbU/P